MSIISKSDSSKSLSSLSSPRKSPKEQAISTEDDSDLTEVSSLFQKSSLANARSIIFTKSLANYIDDISGRIFDPIKKTKPEAIKKELIKLIDLEKAKEVDFGDLSLYEFSKSCREQSHKLVTTYEKIHGFRLSTDEKVDLIINLGNYIYQNLVPLTNASKKFEEKYAHLSNESSTDSDYDDIYG